MAAPEKIAFEFEFEGDTYRGRIDEQAIAAFEDETDRSIFEIAGVEGRPPKMTVLAEFMRAALGQAHPALDRMDCMRMMRDPKVIELLMGRAQHAMPQDGDYGEAGQTKANPPKKPRRGRKGGKTA